MLFYFYFYMQSCHTVEYQQYISQKCSGKTLRKRPSEPATSGNAGEPSNKKQALILDSLMSKTAQPQYSQGESEVGLVSMMIEDMEPMRMVERTGFKAF